MRTIIHLSDLHFGRIDDALLAPLAAEIEALQPDLIAVSGDLTQRARTAEFTAARAFLDRLPRPQIIVPGNHDVPLYNVFSRFISPLKKYQRYITADLEPYYADAEIAVLGINTARSLTFKSGRINATQLARAQARLCPLDGHVVRVIVTHHPLELPDELEHEGTVGRARLAKDMVSACRCDLLLAGHLHVGEAGSADMQSGAGTHNAIVVQAGTATSTRGRGEINSFNAIRVETHRIDVVRYGWQLPVGRFKPTHHETFERTALGWTQVLSA